MVECFEKNVNMLLRKKRIPENIKDEIKDSEEENYNEKNSDEENSNEEN